MSDDRRPAPRATSAHRRAAFAALLSAGLGMAAAWPARGQTVVQHAPGVTITIDTSHARPGGLIVVRLRAVRRLGAATALLHGRRVPFYPTGEGPRALVGIPATTRPGTAQLGIEIRGRRGRRRLAAEFPIVSWPRMRRTVTIPPARIAAVTSPAALRDSRRLLALLRTRSEMAHWRGALRPPVATAPVASFGVLEGKPGDLPVNERLDGLYGEYHRGLDYPVPAGTVVQAPAAGTVLLAEFLSASGHTLVVDHGQGLISLLCHLSRIDVAQGQWIEGRAPVALSGDSGACASPHLHWGTYIHGIAADPAAVIDSAF